MKYVWGARIFLTLLVVFALLEVLWPWNGWGVIAVASSAGFLVVTFADCRRGMNGR